MKLEEYSTRFNLKEVEVSDTVQDLDPIKEKMKLIEKKRQAPGLGQYMMKLAGLNNVELAKRLNFGFYVGHRKTDNGLLKLTDKWG
jgi:predicted RNA-binding protein